MLVTTFRLLNVVLILYTLALASISFLAYVSGSAGGDGTVAALLVAEGIVSTLTALLGIVVSLAACTSIVALERRRALLLMYLVLMTILGVMQTALGLLSLQYHTTFSVMLDKLGVSGSIGGWSMAVPLLISVALYLALVICAMVFLRRKQERLGAGAGGLSGLPAHSFVPPNPHHMAHMSQQPQVPMFAPASPPMMATGHTPQYIEYLTEEPVVPGSTAGGYVTESMYGDQQFGHGQQGVMAEEDGQPEIEWVETDPAFQQHADQRDSVAKHLSVSPPPAGTASPVMQQQPQEPKLDEFHIRYPNV